MRSWIHLPLHPRSRTLELAWASVTLSHSLGAAYAYANANYDTLGLLVQVVAGQSYEAYVEQHIFAPLRMRNSFTSKVAAEEQGWPAAIASGSACPRHSICRIPAAACRPAT